MVNRARVHEYAVSKIGCPYVFGAAGPDAFDCSGLVVAAYAAGGVLGVPHHAATQFSVCTRLDHAGQLRRGDLVFYYGDEEHQGAEPDHVAIYSHRVPTMRGGHHYWVVQATDEAHGVESVRMHHYALPSSFGRLNLPG